jgi:hypothetical protein
MKTLAAIPNLFASKKLYQKKIFIKSFIKRKEHYYYYRMMKVTMERISVEIPRELLHVFTIRETELSRVVRESLAVERYSDVKNTIGR